MSTLDYALEKIRSREAQEMLAKLFDFGIRHRVIQGREVPIARKIIRDAVRKLLARKRLSEDEEARIRARWGEYV